MDDWLFIYRTFTPEELAREIEFLKQEVGNPYSAQTMGSQSAQRDLNNLKNRLSSALRVRGEQGGHRLIVDSLVDFSQGTGI
jgi:hypothetical protein